MLLTAGSYAINETHAWRWNVLHCRRIFNSRERCIGRTAGRPILK